MTVSSLTTGRSALLRGVIAALVEQGYAYNPDAISLDLYLATALDGLAGGGPDQHHRKSRAHLLAELAAEFGGTGGNYLMMSLTQWAAEIVNGDAGGGGGGSYTGPLDLVAGAVVAFSQRALSAAARGSGLYTINIPAPVSSAVLNSGGSGWVDGEGFSILSGSGDAQGVVDTTIGGAIATFHITEPGTSYFTGSNITLGAFLDGADASLDITCADEERAFSSDATTGAAPASAITTFIDGRVGMVSVWNDQSGNDNDLTAATLGNDWNAEVVGGQPTLTAGANTNNYVGSAGLTFPSGAVTVFCVSRGPLSQIISHGTHDGVGFQSGSGASIEIQNAASTKSAGGDFANDTDDTVFFLWDAACEYGATDFVVNGASLPEQSSSDDGGAFSPLATVEPMSLSVFAQSTSAVAELIYFDGILSAPDRAAIRQNIAAYYGITLA